MLRNILIGTLSAILVVAIGTAAYNVITAQAQGGVSNVPVIAAPGNGNSKGNGQGNGYGNSAQGASAQQDHTAALAAIPPADLSAEEAAGLVYMYEEEKLARDVYNALYAAWQLPTFQNIAASEQSHMDSVKSLLDRYSLSAPALAAGTFADPALQNLYTTLVAQGSQSAADALKVGASIEELDILDLQTRLTTTDNADIQMVYTNLMNASSHHLQAFTSALLSQTGEVYAPQYLSPEAYAAALSVSAGNGSSNGAGQGAPGNSGQSRQSGQVNQVNVTTVHGTVTTYAYGTLTIVTDDGQTLGVQTGNQSYAASVGFNPQVGQGVTVTGYPGEQGLLTAISITTDDGVTYTFRADVGRPSWAGGKGRGGH